MHEKIVRHSKIVNVPMNICRSELLSKICYTELVYGRIQKKLKRQLSKRAIEELLYQTIQETPAGFFQRIGKNIYVINAERNMKITINSNTFRVITVDLLSNDQ